MKRKIQCVMVCFALILAAAGIMSMIPCETPIAFTEAAVETESVSLSALQTDVRITFDQSLMLINTEYMLDEAFLPAISEYKDSGVQMNDCMHSAYMALSEAVRAETGDKLYVSSHFRTAEKQALLYKEDPDTATLPGASEHQTGLCLDVYVSGYAGDNFIRCKAGKFVNEKAHAFGFIIRYPTYGEDITGIRYEPWHIRYVGSPHADVIYNNCLTLEEYILNMEIGVWYETQGYLVSRQKISEDGTLLLPENFDSAVISPDNSGCYIITVNGQ